MLGIRHVHIGDDVYDAAVRLLRQALILAAIAGLHVENRNVQPLRADHGKATVGIAQHQHRIGLDCNHQFIGFGYDVAHRLAQIRTNRIHVNLGIRQFQIVKEYAIQVVVVVLTRMRQNYVEIPARLVDHRRQSDDLRPRTHDDQQLQLTVIFE